MLQQPTKEKLHSMRLSAMASAWEEHARTPKIADLSFDERFATLVDAEYLARENRRLKGLLRDAEFRIAEACVEDIKASPEHGLPQAKLRQLVQGGWIGEHLNILALSSRFRQNEAFQNWPRPDWSIAISPNHMAFGGTQHELSVTIVDRVVVHVEAVHLGGDAGGVRDQTGPTINNLADRNFVPALKHSASHSSRVDFGPRGADEEYSYKVANTQSAPHELRFVRCREHGFERQAPPFAQASLATLRL